MVSGRPWLAMLVLGLVIPVVAQAHDPGLSRAELVVGDGRVVARLTFAGREVATLVPLDADDDGAVSPAEVAVARPTLAALGGELLVLRAGGRLLVPRVRSVELEAGDALRWEIEFPQADASVEVGLPLLGRLARGHRQYVAVRDAAGRIVAERILDARHPSIEVALLPAAGAVGRVGQFFALGLEHILGGYDHLLFVLALLLAVPTLRQAAGIISAFTLAHSITLGLAALEIVRVSSAVVEPLIAASIVWVGLENLLRRDRRQRWQLCFGFGLVHGLGFAAALRDSGFAAGGAGEALVPLFSFNLGVEAGQLAVALLALPLIRSARASQTWFPRLATAGSLAIAFAGAWWLIERIR